MLGLRLGLRMLGGDGPWQAMAERPVCEGGLLETEPSVQAGWYIAVLGCCF